MNLAITILFVVNCYYICYQDYKERKVYLLSLISCGLFSCLIFFTKSTNLNYATLQIGFNLIITVIILIVLYTYCLIRGISIKQGIGLGDILFFIILSISNTVPDYILLLGSSLIFALLFQTLLSFGFHKNKTLLIPLAGHQALFVGSYYCYKIITDNL